MLLQNRTPFVPFTYQSLDLDDEPFQVVIVKGTFDIVPGAPLERAVEQEPIRTSDEPWSSDGPSSLRREDDLAPFKPWTDIVVNATAHAPGGVPAREWVAGVSVGRLTKRVLVTGPRVFAHAPLLGWALGPIVPVLEVPIRYERAFGGAVERDGRVEVCQENPVGVGFVDRRGLDRTRPVAAPSILTPEGRLPVLGEPYPVEGLSAISRPWQPRRRRAGSFDAAWVAERHPRLPRDFDSGFYGCAHPGLAYEGYLGGEEEVRLERLCRGREIVTFELPGLLVAAALVDQDGYRCGAPARLDTLVIEAEAMKAFLTWRVTLPLHGAKITRIDIAVRESLARTTARAAHVASGPRGGRYA